MSARIAPVFIALAIAFSSMLVASPATGTDAPSTSKTARQLHDADTALQRQHAQSAQWHARVTELEKQSAAERAAQTQRDRQIAELQRQLKASQAGKARARATPTAKAGGH
ncbi:MAG: hypothetical protein ABI132_11060 [Rhodanobacteraceae bacterium]